VTHGDMLS